MLNFKPFLNLGSKETSVRYASIFWALCVPPSRQPIGCEDQDDDARRDSNPEQVTRSSSTNCTGNIYIQIATKYQQKIASFIARSTTSCTACSVPAFWNWTIPTSTQTTISTSTRHTSPTCFRTHRWGRKHGCNHLDGIREIFKAMQLFKHQL